MISIHALREEGDLDRSPPYADGMYFYPRPPRGGRPGRFHCSRKRSTISIHALREEGDAQVGATAVDTIEFLSTPSARRATSVLQPHDQGRRFLSTPSARRATDAGHQRRQGARISIHALREEGDRVCCCQCWPAARFLSTPSARRATNAKSLPGDRQEISIHALREEGDRARHHRQQAPRDFYPRPPRGGRLVLGCWFMRSCRFLSTPSARRATY